MLQDKIIAHRGASAYAPENTRAAFERARQMGSRFIEFDVMQSADGELFVFHDDELNRTTNARGAFHLASSETLRGLDAGSWFGRRFRGERIPAFTEVLRWLNEHDMAANIEIKPHPDNVEEITTAVLAEVHSYWPESKKMPLVSSFETRVLRLCRSIAPEMPLGFLMHEWQDNWSKTAKELDCCSIHANKHILSKSRIAEIKQYDYKLYAYTVNSRRQAKKLIAEGVDAVFSDYPDLLS
ncbi:glycerophosphoryl diester phosphodiesterase [Legionella londiniensis]|uniref:Glycerophosphoryl diester esterase n=1 Tax=Legionella londiniensis TaxID=45068 RepID=A0A0W0VNA7_9GAMM|nr:glycerophosphoryl diester phosphodiesterase [Legionella londiniensis]KTD21659.1 glycerophosphoryl diester esterase [Legionella londiniensis]STX93506.1 glycerophosphoryl diester phosphodiesterase [Legionella londiniensis]